MSMNHAPTCAFDLSFGDEPCDCDGPSDASAPEAGTLSELAKRCLAEARAALGVVGR